MSNREPVVVEQTFKAPVGRVWRAITDKNEMLQWFFATMMDFRPERGFETRFNVRNEDRDYPHLWRVTEVIPEKKLAYEWEHPGFPGESLVAWELSETADGTKLKLTHEGIETFPQDDPAFKRESCQAGWQYFLGDRLKSFLASHRSA